MDLIHVLVSLFLCANYAVGSSTDVDALTELLGDCKCVRFDSCGIDGIITDGKGKFSPRLAPTNLKKCSDPQFVCCKANPSPRGPTKPVPVIQPECGIQQTSIIPRVMTTDEDSVLPGEFPWVAVLYKKESGPSKYVYAGGGSLIHPKVILTVAFRIKDVMAENLKVIVNKKNVLTNIADDPEKERNVARIIIHPKFNPNTIDHNIALIILNQPYENTVNTICIPSNDKSFDDMRCIVAGFGKTHYNDTSSFTQELKKIEVPIIERDLCENLIGKKQNKKFILHQSNMCAGGEKGNDACFGDGGNALMCDFGGAFFQAGIVSAGIRCGEQNVPGIYTSVKVFRSWIDEQLLKNNILI